MYNQVSTTKVYWRNDAPRSYECFTYKSDLSGAILMLALNDGSYVYAPWDNITYVEVSAPKNGDE